jgi:putative transposase
MLGLSRWAGQGGSYRTVQRFFSTVLPWATLFWVFFRQHLHCPEDVYVLAGDEVVVTKAGKTAHGLDRFFSGLYGKPVPGLAFFALSLVSVQARRSFPLRVEQVVRSEAEKVASKAKAAAKQPKAASANRRPGRPKSNGNSTRPSKPARHRPGPPHQPRNRSSCSKPWAMKFSCSPTRPLHSPLPLSFLPLRLRP